jgi:hypothetical protein
VNQIAKHNREMNKQWGTWVRVQGLANDLKQARLKPITMGPNGLLHSLGSTHSLVEETIVPKTTKNLVYKKKQAIQEEIHGKEKHQNITIRTPPIH